MPLYMDTHEHLPEGATAEDVANAHKRDVEIQDRYGVNYLNYWFDEKNRKLFCLVDAPNPEAAMRVHREAHGLVADKIFEVEQGVVS